MSCPGRNSPRSIDSDAIHDLAPRPSFLARQCVSERPNGGELPRGRKTHQTIRSTTAFQPENSESHKIDPFGLALCVGVIGVSFFALGILAVRLIAGAR